MTLTRTGLAGNHVRLVWAAGLIALLVGAAVVQANVQPPTMLLIHVQGWDPSYCDLPGVNRCQDIVSTTEATGYSLVVVYMVCGYSAPSVISHLDFTLQWGSSWGWYWGAIGNCTDAQFSYENYGDAVTLHFDWPNQPYPPPFMPLCAIETHADGHDCIEILDDAYIRWGYDPWGWDETPQAGKAEAGVECEYSCLLDCDPFSNPNVPQLTPEELHFELPQWQEAEGLLQSVESGWADQCSFDATESWVMLEITQTSYHSHDIRVKVRTLGLAVGEYEARVRETCDARDCSRIYLTVTEPDPQSVPEDDAASPPGSRRSTWGAVKDLYR